MRERHLLATEDFWGSLVTAVRRVVLGNDRPYSSRDDGGGFQFCQN